MVLLVIVLITHLGCAPAIYIVLAFPVVSLAGDRTEEFFFFLGGRGEEDRHLVDRHLMNFQGSPRVHYCLVVVGIGADGLAAIHIR